MKRERAGASVIAAGVIVAGLTGCASSAAGPYTRSTSSRASSVTGVAATPAKAALGFYRSLRGRHDLEFECLPGGGTFTYSGLYSTGGTPTAAVQRHGARWTVTITREVDDPNAENYEVRRLDGGFCVSRLLPDEPRIETTSPEPQTGTPAYPPSIPVRSGHH